MSKIEFIVEKTDTGFSAYASDESFPIGTSGDDVTELKKNIVDAYNSYAEIKGLKEVSINDILITLDVKQFFDYYKIINASALGAMIGMDKTLISQYANGHKKPGPKQIDRILTGIRQLGQELSSLNLSIS
ncbi:hypothetical protein [Pedobacter rhizosphaerae]|uniref:Uncharacterized protein n=1 Tax=Pedobacter rhizosphaerae TaxID=390241 RepID=A0A1H9RQC8_9SPHI|nr:hypothetical protein [Pedobacter rhizosphaerae]SER75010.1 hypothetical protein SAMN04488023_11579 [Pedobacter rhizosphaerae]